MKSRFLKRIYYDKYNYTLEVCYGNVIENQLITIIKELGETKVNNEYVEKPMRITPYKDSSGNPICYDDIVILDYGNDKVIEAKVYFDEHFGIINLKSLGGFIDFSTLANWVNYSQDKKNNRTIKVKFIDDFEKGIII